MLNNLNNSVSKPNTRSEKDLEKEITNVSQRVSNVESKLDDLTSEVDTVKVVTDEVNASRGSIDSIESRNILTDGITVHQEIADESTIQKAEISEATIEKANIQEVVADKGAFDELQTDKLKTNELSLKELTSSNATITSLESDEIVAKKSITTKEINAEDIVTVTISANEVQSETVETKEVKTEISDLGEAKAENLTVNDTTTTKRLSAEEIEAIEQIVQKISLESIHSQGKINLDPELETEDDWYTIEIPAWENAVVTLRGTYDSLNSDTGVVEEKHWSVTLTKTPKTGIWQYTTDSLTGLIDFSFDESTGRQRIRCRAKEYIEYGIWTSSDVIENGKESLQVYYNEDHFETFFSLVYLRGYLFQAYANGNDVDVDTHLDFKGKARFTSLEFDERDFDNIYIKYGLWLPESFEEDGVVANFKMAEENQYVSSAVMNVYDKDTETIQQKVIPTWKSPIDYTEYPTALGTEEKNPSDRLITERAVANYDGKVNQQFEMAREMFTINPSTFDVDSYTENSYYWFDEPNESYYPIKAFNRVDDDTIEALSVTDTVLATITENTAVYGPAEYGDETVYPISHLRDETITHGDHEIENDLTVDNDATVKHSLKSPHFYDDGDIEDEDDTLITKEKISKKIREFAVPSTGNSNQTCRDNFGEPIYYYEFAAGTYYFYDAYTTVGDKTFGAYRSYHGFAPEVKDYYDNLKWIVVDYNGDIKGVVDNDLEIITSSEHPTEMMNSSFIEIQAYFTPENITLDPLFVLDEEAKLARWTRQRNGKNDPIAVYESTSENFTEDFDAKPMVYDAENDSIKPADELHISKMIADKLETEDLYVKGDAYICGTVHSVDSETLDTTDNFVVTRQNNTTGLGANELSGVMIYNYAGTEKSLLVAADNTGTLRIGVEKAATTTTYEYLFVSKDGKYYGADSDGNIDTDNEITPSGILTKWNNKEEVEESDGKLYTKYTNAIYITVDKTDLQPVATRAEASDMKSNALVCWNTEKNRMEATDSYSNATCFTCCVVTPWMCGTSSGVCAWDMSDSDPDDDYLLPIPGWNEDLLRLERSGCILMNPTTGDIFANHIYGVFNGSVDTAACIDIHDWQTAIAHGGLPGFVIDQNGCRIEAYDTNGCFCGYVVTFTNPERLFVPAVVTCTCLHSAEVYGSDWVAYNLCNTYVEYKCGAVYGNWTVANSNKAYIHGTCIDFKLCDYSCGDYTATLRQQYGGRVDLTVNNGYGTTRANASNTFCFCSNGCIYAPVALVTSSYGSRIESSFECVVSIGSANERLQQTYGCLCQETPDYWGDFSFTYPEVYTGPIYIGSCNSGFSNCNTRDDGTLQSTAYNLVVGNGNNPTVGAANTIVGQRNILRCSLGIMPSWNTVMGIDNVVSDARSSVAIGVSNLVRTVRECWDGCASNLYGEDSVAIGSYNTIHGDTNVAIGFYNCANPATLSDSCINGAGWNNVMIGANNRVDKSNSIAIGRGNCAITDSSITIGLQNLASGPSSIVIGCYAQSHESAIVIANGGNSNANTNGIVRDYRPSGRDLKSSMVLNSSMFKKVGINSNRFDNCMSGASIASSVYNAMRLAGLEVFTDNSWRYYGATGTFTCNNATAATSARFIIGIGLCSDGSNVSMMLQFNNGSETYTPACTAQLGKCSWLNLEVNGW